MTKKFWVEQHKGHGELNVNNFRWVRVEDKLVGWRVDQYRMIAKRGLQESVFFFLLKGLIFPDNIQSLIVILNIPNILDDFQKFKQYNIWECWFSGKFVYFCYSIYLHYFSPYTFSSTYIGVAVPQPLYWHVVPVTVRD